MPWPSLAELQEMIQADLADASDEERAMFARVVIPPEKWRQTPYGDEEGGFWAVAVYENRVLWYNNIEEGFNVSTFSSHGEIPEDEYWCNQDRLHWALPNLMGEPGGWKMGPPSGL
jgi:hypothetical protein